MKRPALACLLVLHACTPGEADPDTGTGPGTTGGTTSGTTGTIGTATGTSEGPATDPGTSTAVPTTSTTASTGDASSTGDVSSTGTTGGPEPPPELDAALITDMNRAYKEMHGGWGHHLRGLMRDGADNLWFSVDAGESVLKNQRVRYFRRGPADPAWTFVAEQMHTDGVQQNAGSVLLGNFILTYGVNTSQNFLEECYLDVTNPAYRACNAVTISGQVYETPASSNYVGAAVLGDGARIVWFTVVGDNGGPGQFIYTYNYGGGWNGPVAGPITGGGNDIGYIHAMAAKDGTLALVGQTYFGDYPNGTYGAAVADITPGQAPTFLALQSPDPAATLRSSADLYLDADTDAVHVLALFDGVAAYYHRPDGAAWDGHLAPLHVFPDTYRARFLRPAEGRLWIVRGSASGQGTTLHRPASDGVDGPLDWASADAFAVTAPAPGFGTPAAIYVESPTYQRAPVGALNFALCGEYQAGDHQVFHLAPPG